VATEQADRPTSSAPRQESRAIRPRSRAIRAGLAAALAIAVLAVVAIIALGGASNGHPPRSPAALRDETAVRASSRTVQSVNHSPPPVKTSGKTYGYIPAWLGRPKVPVGRVVTATPSHPWLAVQGDTVRVELPNARVLATVVGPAVPEEGEVPVPKTTLCTFTVTLTSASAPIPIRPRQFAAIDEEGVLHTLKVQSLDGGPPPSQVTPGKTVGLKISSVLPTGGGRLLWAPMEGSRAPVQWDFDVEID
jgi:hypothetical protein